MALKRGPEEDVESEPRKCLGSLLLNACLAAPTLKVRSGRCLSIWTAS